MAVARFAVILLGTLNTVLVTWIARRFGLVAAVTGGLFYALWAPVVVLKNQTRLEPFGNRFLLLVVLVTDQLQRPSMRTVVVPRLYSLSSLAVVGVPALSAMPLAWRETSARAVVVLRLAQTAPAVAWS
jgi:hypothetical protein